MGCEFQYYCRSEIKFQFWTSRLMSFNLLCRLGAASWCWSEFALKNRDWKVGKSHNVWSSNSIDFRCTVYFSESYLWSCFVSSSFTGSQNDQFDQSLYEKISHVFTLSLPTLSLLTLSSLCLVLLEWVIWRKLMPGWRILQAHDWQMVALDWLLFSMGTWTWPQVS